MSNVYESKYGITFVTDPVNHTELHSFRDFGLLPTRPPVFDPPEPRIIIVNIPGNSTPLDMSEDATGHITYKSRKGNMGFFIYADRSLWMSKYEAVVSAIDGKYIYIVPDEDIGFFYAGRCHVGPLKASNGRAVFDIDGQFQTYKQRLYANEYTAQNWLWDPFNFETDYVPGAFTGISIDGSATVTIINSGLATPMTVTSDAEMTWDYFDTLEIGDNLFNLPHGTNNYHVEGTGTLDITWVYRSF